MNIPEKRKRIIPNRLLKYKTKLRSRSGMSIAETLFVVLIVGIISAGLATGVSVGIRQFNEAMRNSHSHVLCSTLTSALSNELRYTKTIHVNGHEVTEFFSPNYPIESGLSKILTVNHSGDVISDYGEIALGTEEEALKILASSSYSYDLGAKVTSFTYDSDTFTFTLNLEIADRKSGKIYAKENFDVRNANKIVGTV